MALPSRINSRSQRTPWRLSPSSCATLLALLAGATPLRAQEGALSQDFQRCKIIADDHARLTCLKKLLPETPSDNGTSDRSDSWPLVKASPPHGGPDAVAILRTADTAHSDPDLAGLMIRCADKPGYEVLLALVRPVPPRSKRDVVVTSGINQSVLHAEASSTGTALVLPIEATAFTTGPWQGLHELAVTIKDPDSELRGVIPLDGLAPAMAKLAAHCPSG
jgi:hypothetical protein